MKEQLINYLACPVCRGKLNLEILHRQELEIRDGIFVCQNCGNYYFLIKYIPRFLPADAIMKDDYFTDFVGQYRKRVEKLLIPLKKNQGHLIGENYRIRLKTIEYFGYEWQKFNNWGWLEGGDVLEEDHIKYMGGFILDTISAFKTKSLINEDDLAEDKLILDAGCGNGRFSYQAARYGGEVIGLDIGSGSVEAAYENTREKDNIHIVQGDLFKLPFKRNLFDTVFSIGVLMHTGDAYKAFESIASHIKIGGVFTAHVYNKLNPIWEFNDFILRKVTTSMSIEGNLKFANFMSKVGRFLLKVRLLHTANLFIRVQPTLIHMYDWYSAPIATHHKYDEVKRWFIKNGFKIIQTSKLETHFLVIKPWSLTVKGMKNDIR